MVGIKLIMDSITLALLAILSYGVVITIISIRWPSLLRQKIVTWAFAYAVVWGVVTALMPFVLIASYPALASAISTSILGAIIVSLGFAVRRGSQTAAWGLVLYALLDIFVRFSSGIHGYIMPFILFVLSFPAAIYLSKRQSVLTSHDEASSRPSEIKWHFPLAHRKH